jgi:signal transduction histidine kinase
MRISGVRKLGKRFSKRMWLLLGLLALLPGMAFVQYLWIGQVSDAARERAKARLENSVQQLVTEFDAEITRAHMTFWTPSGESTSASKRVVERYAEWNRLAPYPQLIRDMRLIETATEPWRLSRVDSSGNITILKEWPADLADLKSKLQDRSEQSGFRRMGLDDLTIDGSPAFVVPLRERDSRAGDDGRRRRRDPRGSRRDSPSRTIGWAVVSLDADFIRREFLPDLNRRLFRQAGESDYELLVAAKSNPETIVFQSDPHLTQGVFKSPDASAGIFAMRPDCFMPPSSGGGADSRFDFRSEDRAKEILTRKPSPCGSVARALGRTDGRWTLLVKHRAGSLDNAFATFRLRTMAISFGVLLVLALGITMLTVSTERARVLAKLQMEFAMGVSHELRTPLTVIRVAADNLANGMTESTQQAQKYGRLIGDEARRLTDMVEQILNFARAHSPGRGSDLAPVPPSDIVGRALAACGPALREAGMEVERVVAPGLPQVCVDENLIVDCLQNLLNNAVKYAASGGWVRVRADAVPGPGGQRVRFAVEDRGPGIDPDDLPHIFDPFYRSEAIRNSQIPGVGLGLSLVKRIVEAHRGTIEAVSSPQSGASFFLYLPADATAVPVDSEVDAEIKEIAS